MAYRKVDESSLIAVADAIREKTGSSDELVFPDGFTSAIANISSGGSGGLNFEVKAYASESALPASASENSIAILTTDEMSSWVMSPAEPESPAEGMVWMLTGASSAVGFNAITENALQIYPLSASQYRSGSWVNVNAKSFQNGSWVDWWIPGTLFFEGIDGTDLTGGWKSYDWSAGSGYTKITETIEITADGMSVDLDTATHTNHSTFIGTTNMIDLTDYSLLKMEFSGASVSTAGTGAVQARVYKDAGYTSVASADVLSTGGAFTGSVEIDVSGLSGEHYIGFFLWKWNKTAVVSANMTLARLS